MGDLLSNYQKTDTIEIALASKNDELIYYSISLEEKIGDEWISVIPDIFKHAQDKHNAKNIKLLFPKEEKYIYIPIQNILGFIPNPYGLCRLRIRVKNSPFSVREEMLTTEFLID